MKSKTFVTRLMIGVVAGATAVAWAAPPTNTSPRSRRKSRSPRASIVAVSKRPQPGELPPPGPGDEEEPAGALLDSVEQQNRLITGAVRAEVENQLREARAQMATDPAHVEQGLKLLLERVVETPELTPEVRAQLRTQLVTALREADRRAAEKEILDQQVEEARAAAADRLQVAQGMLRKQEKLKQLVDRFESLMDEGRYAAADELGSTEIPEAGPNAPVASSTALVAHAVGARAANLAQRNARSKAVVDTLATVEVSFIPFPDDQPIIYPDASVWEEITLRRQKYRSVDLKKFTPAEKKIKTALDTPLTIEIVEEPLQDVVNDLKDLLDIEITLDDKALDDAAMSGDTPITLPRIKGMPFRSLLSLLRKKYGLYYLIQDDMMLMTTKEVAESEENLVRKVYPVGDLVVPIQSGGGMRGGMGMMGGGMMGGGMGMMGGGMGGGMMGGMGGGMMGGMGGGMMGGMGGGMGRGMF